MKKILITGVNSYVGNNLAIWLEKEPANYSIDMISLRDEMWKQLDMSMYDVVVHVAGIAHRKETKDNAEIYYEINRDLAYEIADKSKKEKVKQFIFLSSMSVYGLNKGTIKKHTLTDPKTHYGKSKLQAEKKITELLDTSFKISILRPPMIYGKGCKGNYQRLRKIALKTIFFPNLNNKRSMIYIDNLSEYIKRIIQEGYTGMHFPQNEQYVNTSETVRLIAEINNKKLKLTKVFNPFISLLKLNLVEKVFGDLVYDKELSNEIIYNQIPFEDSIRKTEMK